MKKAIFWIRFFFKQLGGSIRHEFEKAALRAEARRFERCVDPQEKELRLQLLLRIRDKGQEKVAHQLTILEKVNAGKATAEDIAQVKVWLQ